MIYFYAFNGHKRGLPFDLLAVYADTPHGVVAAETALRMAKAAYPRLAWRRERTRKPAATGGFELVWLLIARNPLTAEKAAVRRAPSVASEGISLAPANTDDRPFKAPLAASQKRRSGVNRFGTGKGRATGLNR